MLFWVSWIYCTCRYFLNSTSEKSRRARCACKNYLQGIWRQIFKDKSDTQIGGVRLLNMLAQVELKAENARLRIENLSLINRLQCQDEDYCSLKCYLHDYTSQLDVLQKDRNTLQNTLLDCQKRQEESAKQIDALQTKHKNEMTKQHQNSQDLLSRRQDQWQLQKSQDARRIKQMEDELKDKTADLVKLVLELQQKGEESKEAQLSRRLYNIHVARKINTLEDCIAKQHDFIENLLRDFRKLSDQLTDLAKLSKIFRDDPCNTADERFSRAFHAYGQFWTEFLELEAKVASSSRAMDKRLAVSRK